MSLRTTIWSAAAALPLVLGCKAYDPLYCDAEKRCTDPDRPFCDVNGDYPASEGVGHTCIPEPDSADADAAPGTDAGGGVGDGGGSGPDASGERRVIQLATGASHTCALLSDGALRCWGREVAVGYASAENIGDNEHPYQAGDVPTGGRVKQVAAGFGFTCALYEPGTVRCWGSNFLGQLGYGHDDALEPDQTPDKLPDVELNGIATQLTAGASHACALLESGDVRCWGSNLSYQLATGDQESIGDDEVPGSRSPVQIGGVVTEVRAGREHTCALVEGGFLRCWGAYLGAIGPLGQGGTGPVGDDETPAAAGNISVGGTIVQIAPGDMHSCALLSMGRVRCWGRGGALGYQEEEDIGDDETPASAGDVVVGGPVVKLSAGFLARCALIEGGAVRCWGVASDLGGSPSGFLGYGNNEAVGNPSEAGDVELGGLAADLSQGSGGDHICALMQDGSVRCWGLNSVGELGLGHTDTIGDTETPAAADPVRVLE
jgi:alpha-tubulin suppressor-like RCC1 family protein